eukprot:scaffold1600_cov179-Amphora_coffeaeformis.AAC.12
MVVPARHGGPHCTFTSARARNSLLYLCPKSCLAVLSSIGQLVAKRKQNLQALNCTASNNNSSDDEIVNRKVALIRCVLGTLKTGTNRVDEHFAPAAVELYQPLYHVNASVAVMPIDRLGDFMESLQMKKFVTNSKRKGFEPTLLDDDMIHDICQVYAVDVHML